MILWCYLSKLFLLFLIVDLASFTTNFDRLALTTVTDTVRVWLMNQIITIEKRNVYGNELIYVVSDHAKAISKLTGKKTIDENDIATLEELGFTVRYK